MIKKWKTLPPNKLDQLIDTNQRVCVLNTSRLPSGEKGLIVVNFYDGTRREFLKVPPTFIPVDVTDTISGSKLRESRDFRQTLQKGMLTLVDPKQAAEYLCTPEAVEEYENLVLSEHSAKARNVDIEAEVSKRLQYAHNVNTSAGPLQDTDNVDTVSNKIRGLVEDMISGNHTPKQVLAELKRHQTALKPVDLSYVLANSQDSALNKWLKGALAGQFANEQPVMEAAAPTPQRKVLRTNKSTKKVKGGDFDFNAADDEMTPEEAAADAKHRGAMLSQQALEGQSAIDSELDRMIKGQ